MDVGVVYFVTEKTIGIYTSTPNYLPIYRDTHRVLVSKE